MAIAYQFSSAPYPNKISHGATKSRSDVIQLALLLIEMSEFNYGYSKLQIYSQLPLLRAFVAPCEITYAIALERLC
jgi:hypothetical protein